MNQFHSARSAFLAVLLLCVPLLAHGQRGVDEPSPRLTVSAYTGVRAPFGGGLASVFVPSGGFLVRQDRTGSPLLGLDAKLRLRGPVSLLVGGAHSQTGQVQYFLTDTIFSQTPDWVAQSSDPMWFGKLGLAARFERARSINDTRPGPSTDLFAAAALVREFEELHPAINFGFQGSLPIARRVELVIGLEDYLVFWNEERLAPAVAAVVQEFQEEVVDGVALHYTTSNILQLHVGVSLRGW